MIVFFFGWKNVCILNWGAKTFTFHLYSCIIIITIIIQKDSKNMELLYPIKWTLSK